MNHPASCLPRNKFLRDILMSCFLTAAVVACPPLAGAQAPAHPAPPPQGTSTQAPPSGSPQQTPPADTPPQTGSQPAQSGQPSTPKDTPLPQKDNPNVKPGSEDDVDAIGNRGVGKGVNFYSLEQARSLWARVWHSKWNGHRELVDDPVVTEYVNRVGQNLVRNSDAKVPFTIKVIDSDQMNAFALPGGIFLRQQRADPCAPIRRRSWQA